MLATKGDVGAIDEGSLWQPKKATALAILPDSLRYRPPSPTKQTFRALMDNLRTAVRSPASDLLPR
jgi:hypothetical protein